MFCCGLSLGVDTPGQPMAVIQRQIWFYKKNVKVENIIYNNYTVGNIKLSLRPINLNMAFCWRIWDSMIISLTAAVRPGSMTSCVRLVTIDPKSVLLYN